jgi:hypothetical protein
MSCILGFPYRMDINSNRRPSRLLGTTYDLCHLIVRSEMWRIIFMMNRVCQLTCILTLYVLA